MKKTLLTLCLGMFALVGNAQTISFESGENFTLGDIHSQNGWTTTGCGEGCNIENQVITDDDASDGTFSFKLTTESAFPGQQNPVVGGFYAFTSPVTRVGTSISFDFKVADDFDGDGNDYRFGVSGVDGEGAGFFIALVQFRYTGEIAVVNGGAFANLTAGWEEGAWVNIRLEFTESSIAYYVNDVLDATYPVMTAIDITGMRIVHDNYGGEALIDNIVITNDPLSTPNFEKNTFKHFVDANGLNLSADALISNVAIYNVSGQQLINQRLNATTGTINTNGLSNGVYLAQVEIEGVTTTVKFIK